MGNFNPNPNMPDVSMRAVVPVMPEARRYSIEKLQTVKVLDSAALFQAVMGVQPPPFDETFRPVLAGGPLGPGGITKSWIDTTGFEAGKPVDAIVDYWFLATAPGGVPVVRQMKMTVLEAATYNMPGLHAFKKFEVPGTAAYFIEPHSRTPLGINPNFLLSRADAQAIADEANRDCRLTGDQAVTVVEGTSPHENDGIYWGTEERRWWKLRFKGGDETYAAWIYAQRHGPGFNTPGAFVEMDVKGMRSVVPVWQPDKDDTVAGTCPTPIRLPMAGVERIVGGGLIAIEVERIDTPYVPATAFEAEVLRLLRKLAGE